MYDDEPPHYEPEIIGQELSNKEAEGLLTVTMGFKPEEFSSVIAGNIRHSLAESIQSIVNREVDKILRGSWGENKMSEAMKGMVSDVIAEKMEEQYPDIVENKVNEFAEEFKKRKIEDGRYGRDISSDLQKYAKNKVEKYINGELMESVKKSKEEIDEFAKNYFAKNLFKAMGFLGGEMDKLKDSKLKD